MHWGVALDPIGWCESDLLAAIERVRSPAYLAAVAAGQQEIHFSVREAQQRPLLPARNRTPDVLHD